MATRKLEIEEHSHVVVGSGAAGVACAAGLLQRGLDVVMIDVGTRPEDEAMQRIESLRRLPPHLWQAADIQSFKGGVDASASGILKKLVYGSSFAYGDPYGVFHCERQGIKGDFSFALGGLTNAWGACMLPCRPSEISGWPITFADLEPHYRAVLDFVPLAGWRDGLADQFPLFTSRPVALRNGLQAEDVLHSCAAHRQSLEMAGIHVGNPRLAVYSASRYAENGCVYCGMCMYGCPYELIYKSGDSLQEWLKLGKMRYVDRLFVEQVGDRGRTATLRARDLTSGETLQIDCARIYLAAGTIPTTKLILDSLQYYNKRISALDSQMFLTPVFKSHATPGFVEDEQFTLTQLFFELVDRRECARSVHFQIYPYNDLVGKAVKQFFPRRVWESAVFKNQALSRLMIMQGLLDSKYSPSLDFTLRRDSDRTVLCIRGVPNPRTRGVIRAALWKIARHGRKLGAFAVPFFARLGSPGQSYHCGGSFPMSAAPRGLETDSLGRVAGLGRVHAVDASVLPSIPPTTITFTVMANAHRIASQGPSS